ncbi:hypothetical protein WN944_012537 [Citrus x changshan-huyou]|uniref:VQ domain-containing protein n=1 Tax=Citrus x changshan-huyou TaxID=2935761 RepID=A0AAP0N0D3_9ROSI
MSSKKQEAVKVVLMDTQYVETDPVSFKSVVQKLTGKDSSVAWIKESNSSSAADSRREVISVEVNKLEGEVVNDDNNNYNVSPVSMLSKGVSFKDLEVNRLIFDLEFPPPEELQWLFMADDDSSSRQPRSAPTETLGLTISLPPPPCSLFSLSEFRGPRRQQQPAAPSSSNRHQPFTTAHSPSASTLARNCAMRSPCIPLSPAQSRSADVVVAPRSRFVSLCRCCNLLTCSQLMATTRIEF